MVEKTSKFDIAVRVASAALALDAIIVPFISGGQTLHEIVGIPPQGDYQVAGEATVKQAEAALWGVTMLYQLGKGYFKK